MTSTASAPTRDLYRPSLHYTPAKNWMNDPNGLVFHQGVYHLFYQHNPFGTDWGNMSWGHATSADLHTWTEQPVAIPCDEDEAVFSGSAVVDERNTSGFGDGSAAPMVAVYTSAYTQESPRPGIQAQSLAYSLDEGRTWTKYAGNPVLDRNSSDFRDPKVFWYDGPAGAYWVMVAVEATEQRVLLHGSADLIHWEYLSDFAADGPTESVWECPDLFKLPIDGDPARTVWVLVVSVNPGGVAGGSGTRYFLGSFDGVRFREDSARPSPVPPREPSLRGSWLDWGRDYYAAVSFDGLPQRRVMMGWMNNWDYAAATPTGTWRSAMSIPRELTVRTVNGHPRLIQAPIVPPAARTTDATDVLGLATGSDRRAVLARTAPGKVHRVHLSGSAPTAGTFGLRIGGPGAGGARLTVDQTAGEIRLDRRHSGRVDFHQHFPSIERAPLEAGERIDLEVYIDACSLEVFVQGGLATITDLVFPAGTETDIEFFADSSVVLATVEVAVLG